MAPIFDAGDGQSSLRSLWDAGQDLATTAATRGELQTVLDSAQVEYTAALTRHSECQRALDAVQNEYTAAHGRAVAAGWSPGELRDVGLPRPAPNHRDLSGTQRPADPPAAVTSSAATPAEPATSAISAQPPRREPAGDDQLGQASWDAHQTSFLVASRSSDIPTWYESMRYSRLPASAPASTAADVERNDWLDLPSPNGPADELER